MNAGAPSRTVTDESTLVITPLSTFTGAECTGVDLANLKAGEWDRLTEAYGTYSILVVRDQKLSKPDQIAFSQQFGELELPIRADYLGKDYPALHVVSNIGKDGKPNAKAALDNPGNFFWHTDASYMQRPASTTLLYAIEIPPSGCQCKPSSASMDSAPSTAGSSLGTTPEAGPPPQKRLRLRRR
jgi:taurine dioxygenase